MCLYHIIPKLVKRGRIENYMGCSGLLEIMGGKSNDITLAFEIHPETKCLLFIFSLEGFQKGQHEGLRLKLFCICN